MIRRNFIRVLGGGVVVAATGLGSAGCAGMPDSAIAAWRSPADASDPRRWILAHAILAPHSHNLQSWLVDLSVDGEMTLYLDRSRLLPETDPFSRQMLLSQGTFLELLDMAARERGLRADITLFPAGVFAPTEVDGRPTARIRLVADAGVARDPLFAQVLNRRTNREPYEMRSPSAAAARAIADSLAGAPVKAGFVGIEGAIDEGALQRHRDLANEAWRIELLTPRTLMESIRLLRVGPTEIAEHRDGISITRPMLRLLSAVGLFDRSAPPAPDSASMRAQIDDFAALMVATPAFFWISTRGNDRATQIASGRAWVRAQLAATANGLSMHPLSQALQEYPEQASPYARVHELLGAPAPANTVQMWARLGYGPAIGPSPRRGVDAHLI